MNKKTWEIGETVCYPHDYGFKHLMDIPVKLALLWLKEILPESTLGFKEKVKDINIEEWNNYKQSSWMNKLLIVIDIPHVGEVVGLYNHDGKFSIRLLSV